MEPENEFYRQHTDAEFCYLELGLEHLQDSTNKKRSLYVSNYWHISFEEKSQVFQNLYIVKTFRFPLFEKRVTRIDYFRSLS